MRKDWSASGSDLDLHLDLDAALGRRAGLEEALRRAIQAGRLRPGAGLPSTRTLARHLGVARGTVSAAYDQLVTEGYLTVRPGPGTSIAAVPQASATVAEAKLHADAHTESLGQLVIADLIDTHAYDRHIRAARLRYRRRRDLLLARLQAEVPQAKVSGAGAGLHALIQLPAHHTGEDAILTRAAAHRLALQPLADHWHQPGGHPPGLIIGYSTPPEHAWPAALDTLCEVLR